MRIGVNALYLIPGGVGGTEIYLRFLLGALAEIDSKNQYFIFTNRETGASLVPPQANFTHVPQALRAANRPARLQPETFLLAVSTLHPHKNLDGLLRAFALFRECHPEYRLVVSGIHGFFSPQLHALREKLNLEDSVEFPGWIPREDLYDLFRRAAAFLYPSLFEGFGLPVLEALAAGVPTACS